MDREYAPAAGRSPTAGEPFKPCATRSQSHFPSFRLQLNCLRIYQYFTRYVWSSSVTWVAQLSPLLITSGDHLGLSGKNDIPCTMTGIAIDQAVRVETPLLYCAAALIMTQATLKGGLCADCSEFLSPALSRVDTARSVLPQGSRLLKRDFKQFEASTEQGRFAPRKCRCSTTRL